MQCSLGAFGGLLLLCNNWNGGIFWSSAEQVLVTRSI